MSRRKSGPAVAVITLGLILAGCPAEDSSGTESSVPSAAGTSAATNHTSATAPSAATPLPASLGESASTSASATSSEAGLADWLAVELYLLSGFRTNSEYGDPIDIGRCSPVRDDLPDNALYGVECSIPDGPAELIGAYLFDSTDAARAAYTERLAEYGVEVGASGPMRGECGWEGPELPSLPEDEHVIPRSGTFVNEFGYANLRALFPEERVYVGVLGRVADCAELDIWTRVPPELGATPNPVNVWSTPPNH